MRSYKKPIQNKGLLMNFMRSILLYPPEETTLPVSIRHNTPLTPECLRNVQTCLEGGIGKAIKLYETQLRQTDLEPVPNFTLFKESDPAKAKLYLKMADNSIKSGDRNTALYNYKRALNSTQALDGYANIPVFYDRYRDAEKALIARLYLSLYQLQANKPLEALQTLKPYETTFRPIKTLVIGLRTLHNPNSKMIKEAKDYACSIKTEHPSDSLLLYRELVMLCPDDFEVRMQRISFIADPTLKKQCYLKEAAEARNLQNPEQESTCLWLAEELPAPSPVSPRDDSPVSEYKSDNS
jgi:hypothetical protein